MFTKREEANFLRGRDRNAPEVRRVLYWQGKEMQRKDAWEKARKAKGGMPENIVKCDQGPGAIQRRIVAKLTESVGDQVYGLPDTTSNAISICNNNVLYADRHSCEIIRKHFSIAKNKPLYFLGMRVFVDKTVPYRNCSIRIG
jgi:ATP-dependent exoDNAse (exonuclease V) alpha subunit